MMCWKFLLNRELYFYSFYNKFQKFFVLRVVLEKDFQFEPKGIQLTSTPSVHKSQKNHLDGNVFLYIFGQIIELDFVKMICLKFL